MCAADLRSVLGNVRSLGGLMSNDAAALKHLNNSLFVFEVQITHDYA